VADAVIGALQKSVYPMLVFAPRTGALSEAAAPPIPGARPLVEPESCRRQWTAGLELIGGQRPDNHAQFMP